MYSFYVLDLLGIDVNTVLYELQRARFPANKWLSLANGLRLANAVDIIEADHRTAVSKLHALISRWLRSTTQPNQWITLVEAIVMCDEPTVARDLLQLWTTSPHSGTIHTIVLL